MSAYVNASRLSTKETADKHRLQAMYVFIHVYMYIMKVYVDAGRFSTKETADKHRVQAMVRVTGGPPNFERPCEQVNHTEQKLV